MFHRTNFESRARARGRGRGLVTLTVATLGLASCAEGVDQAATGKLVEPAAPMAVDGNPTNGLAIGALGASGVVVASSAGPPTWGVDLFVGTNGAPSVALGKRLAPRPDAVGFFGSAVALSGTDLAIGATHDDPDRVENGYVDLYGAAAGGAGTAADAGTRALNGWAYRATVVPTLIAPPPAHAGSLEFGFARSVDLASDDLVVGAPRFAGGYGRVFVFHRDAAADAFAQVAELQEADDVQRFDANFGDTVRIDGDTLIVSRPDTSASTGSGSKAGKVYVYVRRAPTAWALQQILESPLGDGSCDGFGTAVALAGELIAVRANRDAWVFARGDGAWRSVWRTAVAQGDRGSIALSSAYLVVGDPATSVEDATGAGAVRVFARDRHAWFEPARTRTEPAPAPGRGFGARMAIQGSRLLVGISMTAPPDSGAPGAYVEDLAGADGPT